MIEMTKMNRISRELHRNSSSRCSNSMLQQSRKSKIMKIPGQMDTTQLLNCINNSCDCQSNCLMQYFEEEIVGEGIKLLRDLREQTRTYGI